MQDGRLAYARGYGLADLERGVLNTPTTLFDIGSTSKQFAAASIALLVADGKLSFTDDIRKYIPEMPDFGAPITINNLMRHTSGLRDYVGLLALAGHSLEEVTTDSQALALVVHQRKLNFPTGSKYEYSNTGYFLLSVIIKRVTGKSLADFARERIFLPLGMTHTMYRNRFAMLIPNRALGYAPDDSGGFRNSMSNWEETGDGAVQLSIEDALKWDENFYHPRVGGEALVRALQERGTLNNGDSITYARGLFIDSYRGLRRVDHGGDWIGYHAAFNRFPDQHTSIVVFCNSDGIDPPNLADKVADIVLANAFTEGKKARRASPAAPSGTPSAAVQSLPHGQLVGSYYIAKTDAVAQVVDEKGALVLKYAGRDLPLMATGPSTFAVRGFPATVEFLVNGDQSPAHALRFRIASDEPDEAVRFTPVAPTTRELRAYVGEYRSPELAVTWRISLDQGKLVFENTKTSLLDLSGPFQPAMRDMFNVGGAVVHFTRDASSHITGFGLSASRMRDIRFDRISAAR
jgi:CubicO group peptidase (beta-lactamase class C family)